MKYWTIVFIYFFQGLSVGIAQDSHYADSLLKVLPTAVDSIKFKIYKELAIEYRSLNFAKSIEYGEKAYQLALYKDDKYGMANILDMIGSVYDHQGGYVKSLEYKLKALDIYSELGNKKGIAQINNNVGVLHFRHQDYAQALTYYQAALKTAEEVKDEESISTYQLNIGEVHQKRGDWDKAIAYELASLKISEKIGITDNRAYSYGILGQVYKAQGKFTKAIEYQTRALALFRKIPDVVAESEYLIRLSEAYTAMKDFDNALKFCQEGLVKAQANQAVDWVKEGYFTLAQIYEAQNNIPLAYLYQKKYITLKDSLLSESMVRQVAQFQTLYKISDQQARIDVLTKDQTILKKNEIIKNEEIQLRNLLLLIFLGGILSIFLVVGILYVANHRKQKDNRLLEQQKNKIQKINDNITDSIMYAKRIQDAMLPTEAQMFAHLPTHFVFFQPRDVVSGDFYWFQEKDGLIFLSAIDCTGHGVPGAFMSMLGDALLNQIVLDKGIVHPDLILNEMHREIRKTLRQDNNDNKDGMDLGVVVLDLQAKVLEFAGAHCPLVLIQAGKLQFIKGNRLSVGGFQPELERVFVRQTFSVEEPTIFYLFSDGYQDQFGGENRRKFSSNRFRELLLEIHTLPTEVQKQRLKDEVTTWRNQAKETQIDDMLVIGVQV